MFPNVPVIIDWDEDKQPVKPMPSNYTIISEFTEIGQNIQVILQTKPKTKKIYMIIGDSVDERNITKPIMEAESKYSLKVKFVLLNKLPYEEMLKVVENAEADSAILYFQWFADVHGKSFIPSEVAKTVCEKAKVPVYGISMQYIGSGIIGGYIGNQELVGQTAGSVALEILRGNKKNSSQVVRAPSRNYIFDWRQLKRWKINDKQLPDNSTIKYREKNIWELYRSYIVVAFVLFMLQALLILGLLINRKKRIRAEYELLQANGSLQTMTEKLISFNKMKDEFIVVTSHELQTPLNGIINISEALAEGRYGTTNRRQEEELKVILTESRRLSLLIKDIIDIEKIKRNELQFNLTAVDIKAASVLVVEVFKCLVQSKSLEIVVNIPERLSPVYADENRLMQVLYNLIGNGVKFTEKGTITLYAEERGEFIKISVEDTGIGISKENQGRLFEAFMLTENEVSFTYNGTGLGLYISRQLLKRMDGQIFLEWSELGKGTRFSFLLPKANREATNKSLEFKIQSEDTCIKAIVKDKSIRNHKILAVDDEPTNLRALKSIFNGEEYEILTASSGMEAIEIIKTQKDIDLVLMDVMMPKMSGYETCRKIREKYTLYDLPVLMLTVRNTPEDISMGFDSGANDFVSKPFVSKELRARVYNLLKTQKSLQQALKNEMAFLQSQIKPHFLYNAISTIMSYCYTDGEKAGELLSYLSQYLRKSFTIDNTATTVSIENELELTKAYTEIEKARFGEKLTVKYHVDDSLVEKRILPLIIQPLVENSIRHGLMKRKDGGVVSVTIKKVPKGIKISVEDNGIGIKSVESILKREPLAKNQKGGVGILNIKRRLMRYYGIELCLNSKVNEGTQVYFIVPIQDLN